MVDWISKSYSYPSALGVKGWDLKKSFIRDKGFLGLFTGTHLPKI